MDEEGVWGLSEEGRGGVCQVVLARAGWGIEREGVAVCVYCKDAAARRHLYSTTTSPFSLLYRQHQKIANNS